MLTVCRFENLVTGLNLFKLFEFHVKAPLTAHICSASRNVVSPPALLKNIGWHGGSSWSLGVEDVEKGQGELRGAEEGEERTKKRREARRSREVRRFQSQ